VVLVSWFISDSSIDLFDFVVLTIVMVLVVGMCRFIFLIMVWLFGDMMLMFCRLMVVGLVGRFLFLVFVCSGCASVLVMCVA